MKRVDAVVLTFLAAAFIAAKAPILDVPAYWDETRWVGQAFQLATWPLVAVFPGFRPAEAFAGHPPGIHLLFALAAKVAGATMRTAHLVSVVFGAIGLCFTYVLGIRIFDRWTAAVAALLLFVCPMYFAQSGMFLADVPVAALATGCVYFMLSGRTGGYLVCAIAMVLIKETSAAIVLAMLCYDMLFARHPRDTRLRFVTRHLFPLAALGAFVTWQKVVTGSWWLIYPDPFDPNRFNTTPTQTAQQAWNITRSIFLEQWRWLPAASLAVALFMRATVRRRRELWLFGLVTACACYPFAFAGVLFLPRYQMPVLPLLFLASAWALRQLIHPIAARALVVAGVLAIMTWSAVARPFADTAELNMRYLDVVSVHREMAAAIEHDFPSARVLTLWPHVGELVAPQYGYVRAPMAVVDGEHPVEENRTLPASDLVWITTVPATPEMTLLRDRIMATGWRIVRAVSRPPVVSELFAPPR